MTDRELMEKIYDKVCVVEADVNTLKAEMQEVKEDIRVLKAEMQEVKEDVRVLKAKVSVLEVDVANLKEQVSSLELTLENETNRNIRVVAEGHLDLARNLKEALAVKSEREMISLKVNVLENDMRIVKNKLSIA